MCGYFVATDKMFTVMAVKDELIMELTTIMIF